MLWDPTTFGLVLMGKLSKFKLKLIFNWIPSVQIDQDFESIFFMSLILNIGYKNNLNWKKVTGAKKNLFFQFLTVAMFFVDVVCSSLVLKLSTQNFSDFTSIVLHKQGLLLSRWKKLTIWDLSYLYFQPISSE